jgi:predicted O-methyltransferase YrrM
MSSRLYDPDLSALLDRLFTLADHDGDVRPVVSPDLTAQERADAMAEVAMPVSRDGGRLLYSLVRASRPDTVVEFGLSMGISTLFLAAALADNGHGRVITTELSARKVELATAHLSEAHLLDRVEIRHGDALETLADVEAPIGLVLLDGWKDLYVPLLRLLEPKLAPGSIVVGDDSTFPAVADYLAYVRDPAHGYVSTNFPVEDGMEISCRT